MLYISTDLSLNRTYLLRLQRSFFLALLQPVKKTFQKQRHPIFSAWLIRERKQIECRSLFDKNALTYSNMQFTRLPELAIGCIAPDPDSHKVAKVLKTDCRDRILPFERKHCTRVL